MGKAGRAVDEQVDALVVVALQDELDAVLAQGGGADGWIKRRDAGNLPFFTRTLSNMNGESLLFAVARADGMGMGPAASRASGLIPELQPACLAMCGICAGNRAEGVSLGDLVVADRVFDFQHGKLKAAQPGQEPEIFHDFLTYNLDREWKLVVEHSARDLSWAGLLLQQRPTSRKTQSEWLLHAVYAFQYEGKPHPHARRERKQLFASDKEWARCVESLKEQGFLEVEAGQPKVSEKGRLHVLDERFRHPDAPAVPSDPPFRVLVGPMGSGNEVIEDPQLFDRLKRLQRKTLAVEMEAAAIGYVGDVLPNRAIVAKAVTDHADHDKDDRYRLFAANISAAWILAFLRKQLSPHRRESRGRNAGRGTAASAREAGEGSDDDDAGEEDLAPLLARHLPEMRQLEAIARALRIRLDGSLASFTPLQRWEHVVAQAKRAGSVVRLVRTAYDSLGPKEKMGAPELWARAFPEGSTLGIAFGRAQVKERLRELFPPRRGDPACGRARELAGWVLLLDHLWLPPERAGDEKPKPSFAPLERKLDQVARERQHDLAVWRGVEQRVEKEELLQGSNAPAKLDLALGIAADTFLAWLEAEPGGLEAFGGWVLEHGSTLDPLRERLVGVLLAWSPPLREAIERHLQGALSRPVDVLCADERRSLLFQIAWVERLLREHDLEPAQALEDWASFRWAERAGLQSLVPHLLEAAGERRLGAFLHFLARAQSSEQLRKLARSARRLLPRAARPSTPRTPAERALWCSLPDASADELSKLREDPAALAHWLRMVDPPYSDAQRRLLLGLFGDRRSAKARRLAERALDLLVSEESYTRTWEAMGEAEREDFLRDVEKRVPAANRAASQRLAKLLEDLRLRDGAGGARLRSLEALVRRRASMDAEVS